VLAEHVRALGTEPHLIHRGVAQSYGVVMGDLSDM
jgi:hypothetical protein